MATIQGLEFIISSDIDTAVRKIDLLGQSLTNLKGSTKGGVGLRTVANQLKAFDDALRAVDLARFDQFSIALERIGAANPKLSKSFVANLAGLQTVIASITDADIDRIDRLATALSKMPAQLNLRGLGNVGSAAAPAATQLSEATQVEATGDAAAQANAELDGTASRVDAVGRAASRASSPLPVFIGLFKKVGSGILGQFKSSLQGIATKITGFFNSIKRIAFYRAIRSAMRMITQGFTEGLKNMYAYSQAVGTQFASSMDRLATSALYLKNSLASLAAPLINALAPAIDFVADKLAALFNLIAQFIARLSGRATYTAAKKVATTWQGAAENATGGAKKAVDEFRRYVLGFDELNILGSDKNSGGGGGGGGAGGLSGEDMFEEREISEGVSDFADAVREAFERHDWQGLGTTIGEKVNEVIDNIPWAAAGEKVGGFVNALFTTAYWTLDTINFQNIGAGAGTFLNNAMEEIDFETVGATITAGFTSLIDTITGFFGTLDWGLVGSSISGFIQGVFDEGSSWIDEQDWQSFGKGMVSSAQDFFASSDGEGVAESISGFIGRALRAAGITVAGVGEGILQGYVDAARKEIEEYGRDPNDVRASALRNSLRTAIETFLSQNPIQAVWSTLNIILKPETMFSADYQSFHDWFAEHIGTPFLSGLLGTDDPTGLILEKLQKLKEKVVGFFTGGAEEIANKISGALQKLISKIADWVREHIVDPIKNGLERVREYFTGGGSSSSGGIGDRVREFFTWPFGSRNNDEGINIANGEGELEIGVSLKREGWTTLDKYVGDLSDRSVTLAKGNFTTLDSYVGPLNGRTVNLSKGNFTTMDNYVGNISTKAVKLSKNGWSTLDSYVGTISAKPLSLYKQGWNSLYDYTGTKVDVGVQLYKSGWTDFKSFIGLKNGGIVTRNGAVKFFRSGGWVQGAKAGAFPAYAGGAVNAGSVFVAGEAGPELVAHVNNRSEVLNQSQIAQTMYRSTVAGMRAIAGDIAAAVSGQINTDNNNQPIVCEVYLDRDRIATAVTRGQQAQNRRYSTTK